MITQIAKFMGPTWGPSGSCRPRMGPMLAPCRPQMGPMLAPWTLLSGNEWNLEMAKVDVLYFPSCCITSWLMAGYSWLLHYSLILDMGSNIFVLHTMSNWSGFTHWGVKAAEFSSWYIPRIMHMVHHVHALLCRVVASPNHILQGYFTGNHLKYIHRRKPKAYGFFINFFDMYPYLKYYNNLSVFAYHQVSDFCFSYQNHLCLILVVDWSSCLRHWLTTICKTD